MNSLSSEKQSKTIIIKLKTLFLLFFKWVQKSFSEVLYKTWPFILSDIDLPKPMSMSVWHQLSRFSDKYFFQFLSKQLLTRDSRNRIWTWQHKHANMNAPLSSVHFPTRIITYMITLEENQWELDKVIRIQI